MHMRWCTESGRFLSILNISLGQWSIFLWVVFYLLIYFNCLKWTSCRVGSVLTFIWSLIFIKSLVLLHYINNLINSKYLSNQSQEVYWASQFTLNFLEKIKPPVSVESLGKLSLQLSNLLPNPKHPHEYLEGFWFFLFYRHPMEPFGDLSTHSTSQM